MTTDATPPLNSSTGGALPPVTPSAPPVEPSTPPSIEALARTIAAALARTLRAYLPVETRSVEARLDALERQIAELQRRAALLGESVAHGHEEAS